MTVKEFIGEKVTFDKLSGFFMSQSLDGGGILAEIRGWGTIQNLFKTEEEALEFQNKVGEFIAQAINDKIADEYNVTRNDIATLCKVINLTGEELTIEL